MSAPPFEKQFNSKCKKFYPVCKNLFKVKKYTRDKGCFNLFYCLCVGFRTLLICSMRVGCQIEINQTKFSNRQYLASKAEEKIQKLHFYYFGNFDGNIRRLHEKNLRRIRRVIKNTNQNYLSSLLGNEVPGLDT